MEKKNVPNHQPVDNPVPKDRRIKVPIQSIDRSFHRFIAERPGQKVWRLRREETTFFSKNDLGGEENVAMGCDWGLPSGKHTKNY